MISGVTVVTTLVCVTTAAHEAADAPSVRHSLRPLLSEGQCSCIARAHRAARMRTHVCLRCLELKQIMCERVFHLELNGQAQACKVSAILIEPCRP